MDVLLARGKAAEVDECGPLSEEKAPRWLWHALDHRTGEGLSLRVWAAGRSAFLELKTRLVPFGITRFYTDGRGAYKRHLDPTS